MFPEGSDQRLWTRFYSPLDSGAVYRRLDKKLSERISVKDFGALGDGSTDDATAVQEALDYIVTNGGNLHFPTGEYVLGDRIEISDDGNTHDEYTKFSISGDGPGNTVLRFTETATADAGFLIQNSNATSGYLQHCSVRDFRIMNNITTRPGRAFQLDRLAYFDMENVYITGWEYGIYATDVLSSTFRSCEIRLNQYGGYFTKGDGSHPNALGFYGCNVANSEYGFYFIKPSLLTIDGGAFEGNGNTGTDTNRYGIKIDHGAPEGSVGCNIRGVYFEYNDDEADIWIDNTGSENTLYNITGCSFNRISSSVYTDHNIRISSSAGKTIVNLQGNSHRSFNTYSTSSTRAYVDWSDSTYITIRGLQENFYEDAVEDPTENTITATGDIDQNYPKTLLDTTSGATTHGLEDPLDDMQDDLFIEMTADGGDAVLTPTSLAGYTSITFNDVGDRCILRWRYGNWHILHNSGCTLA